MVIDVKHIPELPYLNFPKDMRLPMICAAGYNHPNAAHTNRAHHISRAEHPQIPLLVFPDDIKN